MMSKLKQLLCTNKELSLELHILDRTLVSDGMRGKCGDKHHQTSTAVKANSEQIQL